MSSLQPARPVITASLPRALRNRTYSWAACTPRARKPKMAAGRRGKPGLAHQFSGLLQAGVGAGDSRRKTSPAGVFPGRDSNHSFACPQTHTRGKQPPSVAPFPLFIRPTGRKREQTNVLEAQQDPGSASSGVRLMDGRLAVNR